MTVDLAANATVNRTISFTQTPYSNIVFTGATTQGQSSGLPATSVQTIGAPLALVQINAYQDDDAKVSPGSTKIELGRYSMYITQGNAELRSFQLPVRGSFTTADIAANGFKLYANNALTDFEDVLLGTGTLSNGVVTFSNLNYALNLSQERDYEYFDFKVTADIASGATVGRTLGIGQGNVSDFVFGPTERVEGQFSEGALFTIALPNVTITSVGPAAGTVSPGAINHLVYKVKAASANANTSFTRLVFRPTGTFQASDVTRFKLFGGDADGYEADEPFATASSVGPGNALTFNLTDISLEEGSEGYIYLVADMATTAVNGRTIQIQPLTTNDITIASGTITLTASAGGVQTITTPAVAFTASGPATGIVTPRTIGVLHTVKVNVTNAAATLLEAAYQLSGSYQPSDFGDTYDENGDGIADGIEGIYLVYHKTPNVLREVEQDDVQLLNYRESLLPASGSTLTFSFNPNNADDDLNPTLPLGEGYVSLVVEVAENAVLGRTIQASTNGLANFTLASGNKTGSLGNGGLQTIGKASVTISAVSTPAAAISTNRARFPVYAFKVEAANATAILSEVTLTTAGTYQQGDINDFQLYASSDATFNANDDNIIGYAPATASGSVLQFDDLDREEIVPGMPVYFFVVANAYSNEAVGRTFSIMATPASAFTFIAADITGSFPLAAGGVQTFTNPTISATGPSQTAQNLAAGTTRNIVHRFSVTVSGADAELTGIQLMTRGTYSSADLGDSGFSIWYNSTNSFAGSQLVRSFGALPTELDYTTSIEQSIQAGTTGYFFITADLAASATVNRTIQMEVKKLQFGTQEVMLSANALSALHVISAPLAVPNLAVTYPMVSGATLAAGTTNHVIYRFNVAASNANAQVNYLDFRLGGDFNVSDLAANGIKVWYNTTDAFAGSTVVASFPPQQSFGELTSTINNLQINSGTTGYFFITASLAPQVRNNNNILIDQIRELGFVSGNVSVTNSPRGARFTFSNPLSVAADFATAGSVLYPNPSAKGGLLTIATGNSQPKNVVVYNLSGSVIAEASFTEDKQLQLSEGLQSGLYLVKIVNLMTNQVEVRKLMVQ